MIFLYPSLNPKTGLTRWFATKKSPFGSSIVCGLILLLFVIFKSVKTVSNRYSILLWADKEKDCFFLVSCRFFLRASSLFNLFFVVCG